jgi:hypothetical protein
MFFYLISLKEKIIHNEIDTCGIVPFWLLSGSRGLNQTFHPILNLFLPLFFEALYIYLDYEQVFPRAEVLFFLVDIAH